MHLIVSKVLLIDCRVNCYESLDMWPYCGPFVHLGKWLSQVRFMIRSRYFSRCFYDPGPFHEISQIVKLVGSIL